MTPERRTLIATVAQRGAQLAYDNYASLYPMVAPPLLVSGFYAALEEYDALLRAEASPPAALEDVRQGEMTDALRRMFYRTLELAANYGDNLHHCSGEQGERQFVRLMAQLNLPPAALPAETPRAETCGAAPPLGGCERAPGHGGDHETADGIAWRNEHPDAYRRPPQASRAVEGDETP